MESEAHAKAYLINQGLVWVSSNYRCRMGEIDLIMREGSCLVFVEVRARSSVAFGGGLASVTFAKRQKLTKAAMVYLSTYHAHAMPQSRFDVISLDGVPPKLHWVKNAFGLGE